MKKALDFFILPLTQAVVIGIGALCIFVFNRAGYEFLAFAAVLIYAAAGWLYSKTQGKAIRIFSIIFTVLLMWGIAALFAVLSDRQGGNWLYFLSLCNPAATDVVNRIVNLNNVDISVYSVILTVLAPVSVVPTVITGKAFEAKNKTVKIVLFTVAAVICVAFLVLGIISAVSAK